ncbi:MAG: hypothetical protein JRJ77_10990 [Deltaproteobacteria bacterium]|nr:hypothetical protein [Deltaproteobacteria bacterium]
MTKWYGPGRRPHYGSIIEAGRKRLPGAQRNLIKLAGDPLFPVISRATALSLLNSYPGEETSRAFELALMDEEALIRRTAVELLRLGDPGKQINLIVPMLYDPVRAVRMEAALRRSLELEPTNMDYLYALADYYVKVARFQEAKAIAEQMIAKHPSKKIGRDLLDFINRKLK